MSADPEALRITSNKKLHRFRGHSGRSLETRLRFALLMPFACRWNARVRDATARLERWRKS
jgi:hypothetical protein